jgi:hypothetical protein
MAKAKHSLSPHSNWQQLGDTAAKLVNNLSPEQMSKLYEFIDGPVSEQLRSLSDDELLAALTDAESR